ncbi:MAG: YheT family hydrolase [Gemmataceae bacterium]
MNEFRPIPFLGNPHVQTLLGTVLPEPQIAWPTTEWIVPLPDGDHVIIYDNRPYGWVNGTPIVVILHGLGGSHQSNYCVRTAKQLLPHGYRVVRMDMRGGGRGIYFARRIYNAGLTSDIHFLLDQFLRESPKSPVVLVGFSLGGNVAAKTVGEMSHKPHPNVTALVAANAPIDLAACSALLGKRENKFYDDYFGKVLLSHVTRHQKLFPDLPPVRFPKQLSLKAFDDVYTAPRGGYANAEDYYQRSSAFPLIEHIPVPTLLVTARDDPFIDVHAYEALSPRPTLNVRITEKGGHLGFLGFNGKWGYRWLEPQIVEWIRTTVPPTHYSSLQNG